MSNAGYWTSGAGLEIICKWAQLGLTEKEIAGKIELELEKSMFDLATGKTYVEEIKTTLDPHSGTVTKIEKTRKQIPPNPALQMFLFERYKVPADDGLDF